MKVSEKIFECNFSSHRLNVSVWCSAQYNLGSVRFFHFRYLSAAEVPACLPSQVKSALTTIWFPRLTILGLVREWLKTTLLNIEVKIRKTELPSLLFNHSLANKNKSSQSQAVRPIEVVIKAGTEQSPLRPQYPRYFDDLFKSRF